MALIASPTTRTATSSRYEQLPSGTLVGAYLIILTAFFASQSLLLSATAMAASLAFMTRYLRTLTRARGSERFLLIFLVCTMTIFLPFSVWRDETAIVHYVTVLLTVGVAYILTRDMVTYVQASFVVLLAAQAAIFIFLGYAGLDDFPLENIIPGSSSNGVTSYLILLQVHYCIVQYISTGRITFLTPLLTLSICIVGYGRGSLIAATAILVINFLTFLLGQKKIGSLLMTLAIFLILGFTGWVYSAEIEYFIEFNTKIGGGLYDDSRASMIKDYLSKLDVITVFTGADYNGTVIQSEYRGNPHNSFIRAHHIFGIPYLLIMMFMPLFILLKNGISRTSLYLLALLMVVFFRASTEPILFPTLLDIFYFAICFAFIKIKVNKFHSI